MNAAFILTTLPRWVAVKGLQPRGTGFGDERRVVGADEGYGHFWKNIISGFQIPGKEMRITRQHRNTLRRPPAGGRPAKGRRGAGRPRLSGVSLLQKHQNTTFAHLSTFLMSQSRPAEAQHEGAERLSHRFPTRAAAGERAAAAGSSAAAERATC